MEAVLSNMAAVRQPAAHRPLALIGVLLQASARLTHRSVCHLLRFLRSSAPVAVAAATLAIIFLPAGGEAQASTTPVPRDVVAHAAPLQALGFARERLSHQPAGLGAQALAPHGSSQAVRSAAGAAASPGGSTAESTRVLWAQFRPASLAQWQGIMQAQDQATVVAGRTLRREAKLTVNLWRQVCDFAGCIHTVVATADAPVMTAQWSADGASARLSAVSVPLRIQRFRVDTSSLTPIDDVVVLTAVEVAASRQSADFDQTVTTSAAGLAVTTRTTRAAAEVALRLGAMGLQSDSGSVSVTNQLTTWSPAAPRRRG